MHVNWIPIINTVVSHKRWISKNSKLEETMEMKSLKKNLDLKITILHLLCDPINYDLQRRCSIIGGNTGLRGLMGLWTNLHKLKEGSLHCMNTLNDSLSLLKRLSVNDNFKSVYIINCCRTINANLLKETNLSTKTKGPVPTVVSLRRFHCSNSQGSGI